MSNMEYQLAKKIGYENKDIVYNGPIKGEGLFEHLLAGGVANIDNLDEMENVVAFAKQDGCVTTLFGRRRYIPELSSTKKMEVAFGERVAMNSPIQGTAADIIKLAMVNIDRKLKENGYTWSSQGRGTPVSRLRAKGHQHWA